MTDSNDVFSSVNQRRQHLSAKKNPRMTTRLERLLGLLSSPVPSVRGAAARQIGSTVTSDSLPSILTSLHAILTSSNWEARVAASETLTSIADHLLPLEYIGSSSLELQDMLTWSDLKITSVLKQEGMLLSSAGNEFDVDWTGVDIKERIATQKAQIRSRLGLGTQFMDGTLSSNSS